MKVRDEPMGGNPSGANGHVCSQPEPPCLGAALRALARGLWPVVIHPYDAKVPSPGKAPIGQAWGKERPDEQSLRSTFNRHPKGNVGLKLGAEGGVVDVDVDDPGAAASVLARIFPDGIPPTRGWSNADGKFHLLFLWDDRFARYGKSIIKGQVQAGGEVTGNPSYAGLEIRIGAPIGSAKQLQTVIPPSLMANGAARRWNEHREILPAPESLFADLDAHAAPEAGPTKGKASDPKPKSLDDVALAADALRFLGPVYYDDYGQWLNIGFALHCLGQTGLGLWDDWSRASSKYQDGVCEAKWRGMKDDGVKLGSLFHEAKRNGWKRPTRPGRKPASPPEPSANGEHDPPPPGGGEASAEEPPINRTDLGNARRLVKRFGDDMRHCAPWRTWLVWDGRRWVKDRTGATKRMAKKTVQLIAMEAAQIEADEERKATLRWALSSESRKALEAMVAVAESEPGVSVSGESWDTDDWLLNCLNGTIDLRTGKLRPHRREDLITNLCPVEFDPNAKCPRWEQFEHEIFAGDVGVIRYMRRAVGYALTGVDHVQEINILYGDGSNGKNVYLDTVRGIFGDYGFQAEPSLLLASQSEKHPTGVADLCGRRFVSASEIDDGKRFAEAFVKRLTGDRTITARRLYEDNFQFKRTFKVFLATNARPEIRGQDAGIWRRIRLIPFGVTFVKKEKPSNPPFILHEQEGLIDDLTKEASGILALFVRACLEWQQEGMKPPPAVIAATEDYRKDMDTVAEFISECCKSYLDHEALKTQARTKPAELYQAYVEHTKSSGIEPLGSRVFGAKLEKLGYHLDKSNGKCWRLGITLLASGSTPGEAGAP